MAKVCGDHSDDLAGFLSIRVAATMMPAVTVGMLDDPPCIAMGFFACARTF